MTTMRRAWVIARTDLLQLRRSRDFWLPLVIVAVLFFVLLPLLLFSSLTSLQNQAVVSRIGDVIDVLPNEVQRSAQGDTPAVRAAYVLAVFLFAPIAVVVPLTVSSAVGSHTIVGERERGSGEFLAHSPAREHEIYLGKMLASLLPGLATCYLGFAAYALVVNLTIGPDIGHWFFPTPNWWFLILWVLPPFLALVVSLILVVSARVSSAAAAQQASSLVTLPVILGSFSLATGSLEEAWTVGGTIGLVGWILAGAGMWWGIRSVSREGLLGVGS
jgi:ABC-2 type transport system permease protein